VNLDGDTKKRGANKHAEIVQGALMSRRGMPDPPDFTVPPLPAKPNAVQAAKHAAEVQRMAVAEKHWHYLCGELGREGLLATTDEGMLTQAAMIYALSWDAFRSGKPSAHAAQAKAYMQIADRMGLNESARAKFPKQAPSMDELEAALCG
jgi:hypothetical protein